MEPDPRLAEASDPATVPERLDALLSETLATVVKPNAASRQPHRKLLFALVRNPGLPRERLRQSLLGDLPGDEGLLCQVESWYNPNVPLLMLSEPDPAYEQAALRALLFHQRESTEDVLGHPSVPLGSRVAFWADYHYHWAHRWTERRVPLIRAFARHLATLFTLPWPADVPRAG